MFGKILSEEINSLDYDLVIVRDDFLGTYVTTTISVVFIGYTTFDLFKEYLSPPDENCFYLAENIEKIFLNRVSLLILSSKWAKENVIQHYGVASEKVKVVEFGANMPTFDSFPVFSEATKYRLLFIGKDWVKKGGRKAYDAYQILKQGGFSCSLTIIGSQPTEEEIVNDRGITILPCLSKDKEEDLSILQRLLTESDFLIFPTQFDCYGIVFCEASAYGVPSIATDVGGVG